VRYGEGVFAGYRHYDAVGRVVSYPFGHGLSYTTFAYSDLDVAVSGGAAQGDLRLTVAVTVTNSGLRAGKEVAQVYVGDPESSVRRPDRELKAFAKLELAPGASQRVELILGWRDLAFWSASAHRWRIETGRFDIAVGASSRDIRLTASLDLAGDGFAAPLEAGSTLQEWLDDPDGGDVLRRAFAAGGGALGSLIGDRSMARMLGQLTLATIASFGMLSGAPGVDDLVAEVAAKRRAGAGRP
jgi:beta-glucosidase